MICLTCGNPIPSEPSTSNEKEEKCRFCDIKKTPFNKLADATLARIEAIERTIPRKKKKPFVPRNAERF